MATAAQIIANQANAQHSTGPKTEAGKASSAQNATTYALTSKYIIVLSGQEERFAHLSQSLTDEFQPDGAYQEILFQQILHAAWNLERCRKAEFDLQSAVAGPATDILTVQAHYAQLKLIATYASRAERSMAQTVKELRRVQSEMFYRREAGFRNLSPLIETKPVLKLIVDRARRASEMRLAALKEALEAPPPRPNPEIMEKYRAARAAAQAAAQKPPTPAVPPVAPKPAATPSPAIVNAPNPIRCGASDKILFAASLKK
ncbi:MAG: hypothetical protein JNK87_34125 [Bryobacterales bacterium]|nr:hypothetical protein [Bryobacterales bacterium]